MKIAMIGTGYVGLVSGVCFSDFGHEVVCVDKDPAKVEKLRAGQVPMRDLRVRHYVALAAMIGPTLPQPVPADLAHHVQALQWAEGLILVYPTWWYAQPAILKGWMDRVWRPGIAFTLHEEGQRLRPALANIRLIGVITTFGSPWWFWTFLMGAPGRKIILRGLRFCTHARTRTFWLGLHAIEEQADLARRRYIDRVRTRIAQIPL